MTSLIFRTATPVIMLLLIVFSIYALLRGHHDPGGGFIGGLLIAAAFSLHVLSHDVPTTRKLLWVNPHVLVGGGMLMAALAGILGMVMGGTFLEVVWGHAGIFGFPKVELSSALLFDLGVYAVVMGVVLMIVFAAAETVE